MSLILLLDQPLLSNASVSVTFIDSIGNPLPAGVQATFTGGASPLSLYIQVGGVISSTALTTGTSYTVSFIGTQAPTSTVSFTAAPSQTITVPNYVSPDPSQTGYAQLQTQLWPAGWFSDAAKTSGGNAYNLAYALGWLLNQLDNQWQYVNAAERLQSSVGASIDSWVADFFGNSLPRNAGETDSAYINRAIANLSAKKGVRAGILAVAQFYGTSWVNEPWYTNETGAWDTNGVFAWDTIGGWGDQNPLIQVYVTPGSQTAAQAQAMKNAITAARGAGIVIQVISVQQNANDGYGIGTYLQARYGLPTVTVGTIL